jgi:hypothetical protein
MNLLKLSTFVAAALFSVSAFAAHCPADMKKIDEAMAANPQLTEEQAAEVKKLRAEGEELHKAGNHGESVKVLGKAMSILGIQ